MKKTVFMLLIVLTVSTCWPEKSRCSEEMLQKLTSLMATLGEDLDEMEINGTTDVTKLYPLMGYWDFTYTLISTYTDEYKLYDIYESESSEGEYYIAGYDVNYSWVPALATYYEDTGRYALLASYSVYDQFFTFNFTDDNTVSGTYYMVIDDDLGSGFPFTGTKTAEIETTSTTTSSSIATTSSTTTSIKEIVIENNMLTKGATIADNLPQGDTDCEAPAPSYAFSTDDEFVCSWVFIDGIVTDDVIRWRWHDPDSNLFYEPTFFFDFDETGCAWCCLGINGYAAESSPGNWQVETYYNGEKKLTENFTLAVPTTTTTMPQITTTTMPQTTTTTSTQCPTELIYGEHSEQTELLRYIRDNVLAQTPEGREIIKLYYEWSPAIVRAIESDPVLGEDIREMVDEFMELKQ